MRPRDPSSRVQAYLTHGESVQMQVQRHWARILPPVASCLCGFILVIVAGAFAPAWMGVLTNAAWWIWLVLLGHMIWRIIEWRDETFVVTNKRLILVYGIFRRKVAMMPLGKVTDMSYDRSILARMLGFGTFVMESAGQAQALDSIHYVRDPDERYRELCGLIFGHDDASESDDLDADPSGEHPDDHWSDDQPDDWANDWTDERVHDWDDRSDAEWSPDADEAAVNHLGDTAPLQTRTRTQNASRSSRADVFDQFADADGSPRPRPGRHSDPSDITDPYGITAPRKTHHPQTLDSDARHTYTDPDATETFDPDWGRTTADFPDDDPYEEPAWSVSREHVTRPQRVRRVRYSDNLSE